jgi:hypothetical protein
MRKRNCIQSRRDGSDDWPERLIDCAVWVFETPYDIFAPTVVADKLTIEQIEFGFFLQILEGAPALALSLNESHGLLLCLAKL